MIISDFVNTSEAYTTLCNTGDSSPYINFAKYGITDLTIPFLEFIKVIFNTSKEPSFENIKALTADKNKQKFLNKAKLVHKYYKIIDNGKVKLDNDPDDGNDYDCENENYISLGSIHRIKFDELY